MTRRWAELPLWIWGLFGLASVLLIGLSATARIPVSLYEAVGFTTGVASVWLMKVDSPVNWPVGVVNAAAYAVLFLGDRLWGDGSLSVFYVISGLLGWYWWTVRGPGAVPAIRRATRTELGIGIGFGIVGIIAMHSWFVRAGNPSPAFDAVTTALSILGQWLLMRRAIENWIFWLLADAIYIPLYISRGFHVTALLFAIYLVLAVLGLLDWRRQLPVPLSGNESRT